MNPSIKAWVSSSLDTQDDHTGTPVPVNNGTADLQSKAFGSVDTINSLLLYAKTQADGLIKVKEGFKTRYVSPIVYVANYARVASEIAHSSLNSDPLLSAAYGLRANLALFKIAEHFQMLSDSQDEHVAEIDSLNAYYQHPDSSLNALHQIVQVKSLLSECPLIGAKLFTDREQAKSYFDGHGYHDPVPLDINTYMNTAGVNAYFINKLLAFNVLDIQSYFANIGDVDPNPPVMYLLDSKNFNGASLLLHKVVSGMDYAASIDIAKDFSKKLFSEGNNQYLNVENVNVSMAADVLERKATLSSLIAPRSNVSDYNAARHIGYALSFTSSLGFNASSVIANTNSSEVVKFSDELNNVLIIHSSESADYAAQLMHSKEDLQKASEQLNSFLETARL